MTFDPLTHLLALAARLEGEGQYNNAKLLRAAADALLTRAAHRLALPNDRAALVAETDRAIETLAALNTQAELMAALNHARAALAEGRLPRFVETPDPFVCRTCGHLALGEAAVCPACGSQPDTFKRFRPVYWLEAFDPFTALEHLHSTPKKVAALLDGVADSHANQAPAEDGWSLRQAISHLRDAQGVLDFRVNLILDHQNPILESKAVFEWATHEADKPPTVREIFETYRASRAQTAARLESIPLEDWWRRGRHEEFGDLRLYQQVSYFACHELTHFPQLESLT